jgi:hypothetical protein
MYTVDTSDFQRLAAGAAAFDKPLRAATRKQLNAVGRIGGAAVKGKIRTMPSKGGHSRRQGSLRRDIAAAVRVTGAVSEANVASVKVRVVETGALAAENRWRVAQLLDKGGVRHPVYGHRDAAWVDQPGYPYFRSVLMLQAPAMRVAARAALEAAVLATIPNVR